MTFEELVDQVLRQYKPLLRKWKNISGLSMDETKQTARIVVFQTSTRYDEESTVKLFAKKFVTAMQQEMRENAPIHVPRRARQALRAHEAGLDEIEAYRAVQTRQALDVVSLLPEHDQIPDHDPHSDLVVEGAKRLVAQALAVLSPIERAVVRFYFLESDPRTGTTDDEVAYLVSEYSEELFGEEQKFTRRMVQYARYQALDKMRAELRPEGARPQQHDQEGTR